MSDIGIVAGLEAEARTLRKLPDRFIVTVSGMGPERAYAAAKRLVDGGASALVSWGSAASLDERLCAGGLVVPERIVGADNTTHAVYAEWQRSVRLALSARIALHAGAIAEASGTLHSAADKRTLRARSRAAAADMESAGVAKAAAELGVPFIAVRAIADGAHVAVPPQLVRAVGADGEIDVALSAARLVVSPWHWPAAIRLGLGFRAALLTLRMAAPALYASLEALEHASVSHTLQIAPVKNRFVRA